MPADDLIDGLQPAELEAEAKERWGTTESWKTAQQRTRGYKQADWTALRTEVSAIEADLAALMAAGTPADDAAAMDAAERHRLHIDRWFYPCPHAMHAMLGQTYTDDPRFEAYYEKRAAGLARFVRDAIAANTARHGA